MVLRKEFRVEDFWWGELGAGEWLGILVKWVWEVELSLER
jgi:hypothetical protein